MTVARQFYRAGCRILDLNGNLHEEHKSIAKAKRWSRLHQKANGGLGMGSIANSRHARTTTPHVVLVAAEIAKRRTQQMRAPRIQYRPTTRVELVPSPAPPGKQILRRDKTFNRKRRDA